MRILYYMTLAGLLLTFSCESPEYDQKGAEAKQLQQLYTEIAGLAAKEPCEDPAEWTFTPVGSKPCGGPSSYLAYSKKIDTTHFLERVALYTELEISFNEKWDVSSDCAVVPAPVGVMCVDGAGKLVYVDGTEPGLPSDSTDTDLPADTTDNDLPADSTANDLPADSTASGQ